MKYLADDGKVFEKENDCREYEESLKKKKNEEILEEMKELDLRIWRTFHPEDISIDAPSLVLVPIWLKSDICSILIDFENSKEIILEMIHGSEYEKEILDKYLKWTDIEKNVEVRKDAYSINNMNGLSEEQKKELKKIEKNKDKWGHILSADERKELAEVLSGNSLTPTDCTHMFDHMVINLTDDVFKKNSHF